MAQSSNKVEASAIELDSHADSPVVDKNSKVIRFTGVKVKVSGFTDILGKPLLVDVVDAVVVYDCPYSGVSFLMMIRNALYMKQMTVNLIPPFMMRLASIEINECPKFMARHPTEEHHSIYFPNDKKRIPLLLDGIISYFPTRIPTDDEIDEIEIMLELTPNIPRWNPHDEKY